MAHRFSLTCLTLTCLLLSAVLGGGSTAARAEQVLIEAESFQDHGGWKLDTQFIDTMGSPYLLAHGLGRPVSDAVTEVESEAPVEPEA